MTTARFDAHYQLCFLTFALRDSSFLSRVRQHLEPEFFTDEQLQRIIRLVLAFYDEHGTAPDRFIFSEIDALHEKGKLSTDVRQALRTYLDVLYKYQLQNRDYLLDSFADFVRFQRIEAKLPEFIKSVKARDFDDAKLVMQEMFAAPEVLDLGQLYTSDAESRIDRRVVEEKERCWTLIWEIDQYIDGLRPGEMGVWQSRQSSDGKTAALILLARNFAFQGKKVLFQFLEGTQEGMEDRMDQCFAGLSRAELLEEEKIERRLARYLRQGSVWMQKFPAYSTKVSQLYEHARNLRAVHNWVPDVVIVDYLDLCAPETTSLRGDLYESGREVYSRFLEWLQTDSIPGWTALQSNRQAMKEQTAGQAHTGGSLAKVQLAHLVLSINRSPDEKRLGEATIVVVKNRDGRANLSFTIRSDFERMAFAVPDQNVIPEAPNVAA